MSGGRPKLTPEQVAEAHDLRAEGFSVHYIAQHFGVTPQAIHFRLKQPRPVLETASEQPAARWRVERDRNETQYLRGWTACDTEGHGAWFPTWVKAWRFAVDRAQQARRECAARTAEQVSLLQVAFPWSNALAPADRARFAGELAEHGSDHDTVIEEWHAAARYAQRALTKARGRAS